MTTAQWALLIAIIAFVWQLVEGLVKLSDRIQAKRDRRQDVRARTRGEKRDAQRVELQHELTELVKENLPALVEVVRDAVKTRIPNPTNPALDTSDAASARQVVNFLDDTFPLPPSGVVHVQAGPATTNIQGEVIAADDPRHPRFGHHTPADLD